MYEPIRTEQITLGSTLYRNCTNRIKLSEEQAACRSHAKRRRPEAAGCKGVVPRAAHLLYQLSDGGSRHRHTVRGQVAAESRRCHACRLALFVSVSTGSSNKRSFLPERASKQRTISLRTEHVPWQLNSSPSFTQPQPPTARRAKLRRSCVEAALPLELHRSCKRK